MELNSKQRSFLSSKAQKIKPVVYLGKQGLTPATLKAAEEALKHHELVKIKCVDLKELKKEMLTEMSRATDSALVRIIGNTGILYRENPDIRAYRLPE